MQRARSQDRPTAAMTADVLRAIEAAACLRTLNLSGDLADPMGPLVQFPALGEDFRIRPTGG